MIDIRNRGTTSFEVEVLFRSLLQDEQIYEIDKLLKIIGKFAIVDKKIIDSKLKNPMKLRYIAKAVKSGLINQFFQSESNNYYFTLAPGGIYFLQQTNFSSLNLLPLNANHRDKSKILTFNYWATENHFDLIIINPSYNWYICRTKKATQKAICYFKFANLKDIRESLYAEICKAAYSKLKTDEEKQDFIAPDPTIIDEKYNFYLINNDLMPYNSRSVINSNDKSIFEMEIDDSIRDENFQLD